MDPSCEMVLIYLMHISNTTKCGIMSAVELYCETNLYTKMHIYMDRHITHKHSRKAEEKGKQQSTSKPF